MKTRWYQGILFLTTAVVVGVALMIGAIFIIYTVRSTRIQTQQSFMSGLDELLDTVESTVSIACFVHDDALAVEVTHGLLKNSTVLGVEIKTDDKMLAYHYRKGMTQQTSGEQNRGGIVRTIHSPFNPREEVGKIIIYPNTEELERIVDRDITFLSTLLIMQLIAVVSAIVVVILKWIVNPIKGMSDYLHHMGANAGDRLQLPYGHAQTEVGRLTEDINSLTDRLVTSWEDERRLRLRHSIDEKKYRAIFDNAEMGIFIADRESRIESANLALVRLFEPLNATDLSDYRLTDFSWKHPERPERLIILCIEKNMLCDEDLELTSSDGATLWVNFVVHPIGENRVQGVVSDITERKQVENLAQLKAITDPLTGLANRLGFEELLWSRINRDKMGIDIGFTLMLLDLDGFKRTNEALGLPVGDEILRMVGERIRKNLKPSDIVARLGGDEFAILLSTVTNLKSITTIAERLIHILEQHYNINMVPIKLGVSIGVVIYPNDGRNIPLLLRNAALALGHARVNGGNRFSFFEQGMLEVIEQRRVMETDMELALKNGEFRLFFQPIVDVFNNCLVGSEALIRWFHPKKGMIAPDTFIPLAEEMGIITHIGRWCIETACQQLAIWKNEGKKYYISVNISGRQIPHALSPKMLSDITSHHGVDPSRLKLELTEGVFLADVNGVQQWLDEVHQLGHCVYLDDFGTGYSSLSYLKRFSVDTIKIDKSFVRDMGVDTDDYALVEAIVVMARTLGMKAIAEGVETYEQLELLRKMRCDYVQGFYFSRPISIEEFSAVVDRINILIAS